MRLLWLQQRHMNLYEQTQLDLYWRLHGGFGVLLDQVGVPRRGWQTVSLGGGGGGRTTD